MSRPSDRRPEAPERRSPGAPRTGAEEVALPGGAQLSISAQGHSTTTDGTTVYDAAARGQAQVALQTVPGEGRALTNELNRLDTVQGRHFLQEDRASAIAARVAAVAADT